MFLYINKMNIIEFADINSIKWFPINIKITKEGKIPSYPKEYNSKVNQNDFKNLNEMEILERHDYLEECNCIALDTNKIRIIDVDFEDNIDYEKDYPEAYQFVQQLIDDKIPYKKSNTKKKGKHFFVQSNFPFNNYRTQTIYKHIELLTGQWAYTPKDRKLKGNMEIPNFDFKNIVKKTQTQKPKIKKNMIIKKITNIKMFIFFIIFSFLFILFYI